MIRHLLLNRERWDKTAVIDAANTYTYRDLAEKAFRVQQRLGHARHENVAILLPNGADYIAALFGVWMAGKKALPLNVQLTASEIAPLMAQVSTKTVITSTAYRPLFEDSRLSGESATPIFMEDLPAAKPEEAPASPHGSPDETIVLLTTSGTTGREKIVQITERNIKTSVLGFIAYNDYPRFTDVEIRYTLGTPFSSVYGLLILMVCIINAFPIVVPAGAFTLEAFYSAVQTYKVTHYEGGTAIPVLMEQMLGRPASYNLSSLRFVGFGGSKIAAQTIRHLSQAFPDAEFCPGYGMTESASLIARPYKRFNPNKPDSIGIAIPGVTVRVDVDGDITAEPLAVGELVVKGDNVTPGYYRNEEETRKIIKNGWLYTGDIGYIDAQGDIFICGRKKNVIMVRGFSVYAEEVEAILQTSGLVKDCIVYGQTDAAGNEMLCADIIPISQEVQETNLRIWCMDHLAGYKQPHRIQLVNTIAKTATGKIERVWKNGHEAD